jgi:hypothetical protein
MLGRKVTGQRACGKQSSIQVYSFIQGGRFEPLAYKRIVKISITQFKIVTWNWFSEPMKMLAKYLLENPILEKKGGR